MIEEGKELNDVVNLKYNSLIAKRKKINEEAEYAFALNEFFSTIKDDKFIHEDNAHKWLDSLTTNKKYPFFLKKITN